jgi:SAM-dependent methyltransferase
LNASGQRLFGRLPLRARHALGAAADRLGVRSPASPGGQNDSARLALARQLLPAALAVERQTVTNRLYDRLDESDLLAVEALIRDTPGAWEHYFGSAERATSRGLLLTLGMWLGPELLSERTGLIAGEPPEHVHAMSRGALTAAGGLYEADMVVDAVASAGTEMADIHSALDFGCSSGRVLRSLSAAYPEIAWHGCDPNAAAIEWAQGNLTAVRFFANGSVPPLPLEDASLDLAYAISIWSHFEPQRGLQWLSEMHRLLRPGAHLVITTHGLTSVDYYLKSGQRSIAQSQEIEHDLYKRGWWYSAEFGAQGDWGVVDPHWGTAFVSPEWLLSQLSPAWRVLEFAPGRNQDNQDVYVLQRA